MDGGLQRSGGRYVGAANLDIGCVIEHGDV